MNRREFIAAAAGGAGLLTAKDKKNVIGRNRISAISDEVATSPGEAIAFTKEFGMEWLELRNVPGSKQPYFYMTVEDLKPATREFSDNGIRISFLNTSLLKFGLPGTEPIVRRGKETLEARAKREFDPMCKVAEQEGVRLLIENEPSCNVGDCGELAAMFKVMPSKVLGANWDALNGAALNEAPFPDGYGLLPKDKIWNVQIEGKSILDTPQHLDWICIIHSLEQAGYTGELGLETHYFDGTNIEKSHLSMAAIMKLVS